MKKSTPPPPKIKGLAHLWAATLYSLAGARRVWAETALRQNIVCLTALVCLVIAFKGLTMYSIGLIVLCLLTCAAEALNTAIEEIVDHLTDDWAAFAKHAKDLGSFAVMCCLIATGLYALGILTLT